jgi:hypothetical protein
MAKEKPREDMHALTETEKQDVEEALSKVAVILDPILLYDIQTEIEHRLLAVLCWLVIGGGKASVIALEKAVDAYLLSEKVLPLPGRVKTPGELRDTHRGA